MGGLAGIVGMVFMATFLLAAVDSLAGLLVGEIRPGMILTGLGLFCFFVAWLNR